MDKIHVDYYNKVSEELTDVLHLFQKEMCKIIVSLEENTLTESCCLMEEQDLD